MTPISMFGFSLRIDADVELAGLIHGDGAGDEQAAVRGAVVLQRRGRRDMN